MACLVRTVLVFMAVFLSTGCASSGNLSIADVSSETVAMQLHKGRTSQADVRRLFGDPLKTSFSSNGNETWEYEFSRLQSKPTNFIPYVSLVHSGAEGEKKEAAAGDTAAPDELSGAWSDFIANRQLLRAHGKLWCIRLDRAGNLANNLCRFVEGAD